MLPDLIDLGGVALLVEAEAVVDGVRDRLERPLLLDSLLLLQLVVVVEVEEGALDLVRLLDLVVVEVLDLALGLFEAREAHELVQLLDEEVQVHQPRRVYYRLRTRVAPRAQLLPAASEPSLAAHRRGAIPPPVLRESRVVVDVAGPCDVGAECTAREPGLEVLLVARDELLFEEELEDVDEVLGLAEVVGVVEEDVLELLEADLVVDHEALDPPRDREVGVLLVRDQPHPDVRLVSAHLFHVVVTSLHLHIEGHTDLLPLVVRKPRN